MKHKATYRILAYLGLLGFGLMLGLILAGNGGQTKSIDHQSQGSNEVWGCPMDPQVKAEEAGKCPICGMDLVVQSTKAEGNFGLEMTEAAAKLAEIQTSTLRLQEDEVVLTPFGAVRKNGNGIETEFWLDARDISWLPKGKKLIAFATKKPSISIPISVVNVEHLGEGNESKFFIKCALEGPHQVSSGAKMNLWVGDELEVQVRIPENVSQNWLMLPAHAIIEAENQSFVYVRAPGRMAPQYNLRKVSVAVWDGHHCWIESGLLPGEEVVTYGAYRIEGARKLAGYPLASEVKVQGQDIQVGQAFELDPAVFEAGPIELASDAKAQLEQLLSDYFELKTALVEGKSYSAAVAASKMALLTQQAIRIEHSKAVLEFWETQSKTIHSEADMISGTKDLEMQRRHFAELSPAIVQVAKAFQLD